MIKKQIKQFRTVMQIGLPLFLLVSCAVKDPVQSGDIYPEILAVHAPEIVYMNSEQAQTAWVKVSDPQGAYDIKDVRLQITTLSGQLQATIEMTDDGRGADLLAQDCQFVCELNSSDLDNQAVVYQLIVTVRDQSDHETAAQIDSIQFVLEGQNQPPVIMMPVVPEILPLNLLDAVQLRIQANDPQGLSDIDTVRFQIYAPLGTRPYYENVLNDAGQSGDSLAGDGVFSIIADFSDTLRSIGVHLIRFQAQDKGGLLSTPRVATLQIIGVNTPPELSELIAPDRVDRQSLIPFTITVRASDPQGVSDIRMVYFNSVKPDGTEAEANPIILFDDGLAEHEDNTAGDGVYSRGLVITPQNMTGIYVFTFYAEDFGGNVSLPLIHELRVIDGGGN